MYNITSWNTGYFVSPSIGWREATRVGRILTPDVVPVPPIPKNIVSIQYMVNDETLRAMSQAKQRAMSLFVESKPMCGISRSAGANTFNF